MKAELERVRSLGDELTLRMFDDLDCPWVAVPRSLATSILALIHMEEGRLVDALPEDDIP